MARNKRKNRIANTLAVCFWLCAWQAAAAYVRRMQAGRTLLCITHEEGDAALLGARVFRLPEAAEQQEGR